jgi:hypothetical protein
MTDLETLQEIRRLITTLSDDFRNELYADLQKPWPNDEDLKVRGDGKFVLVDFGRTLRWFKIENDRARYFAMLLIGASGARIEQIDVNTPQA